MVFGWLKSGEPDSIDTFVDSMRELELTRDQKGRLLREAYQHCLPPTEVYLWAVEEARGSGLRGDEAYGAIRESVGTSLYEMFFEDPERRNSTLFF